jgi:hypothetical protein
MTKLVLLLAAFLGMAGHSTSAELEWDDPKPWSQCQSPARPVSDDRAELARLERGFAVLATSALDRSQVPIYAQAVLQVSRGTGEDPFLLIGLARNESDLDPNSVGSCQ